jgi:hypothetical protein
VEALELLELLAGRCVEDRLPGHRLDRERRPTPGISVELGQQYPVELGPLGELRGHVDRVLSSHRVEDQQHVVGAGSLLDLGELVHQLLVDVQAPGGIDDERVGTIASSLVERPLGDVDGVALRALLVDRRSGPLAHRHQLLDRRRPLGVTGSQCHALAVLRQELGELGAGRGLPGALQARDQDHARAGWREGQIAAGATHERGQLLVDDLHHLLARIEGVEDTGAQTALLDLRRERLDDLEVDVGLQQSEADLPHRRVDVGLGQLAARPDVGQGRLEAV